MNDSAILGMRLEGKYRPRVIKAFQLGCWEKVRRDSESYADCYAIKFAMNIDR